MRPIDANALIKTLEPHSMRNGAALGWHSGLIDAVIDEIRKMPTIGGWISAKDRLPGDEGDVIVYGVSPRGRKKTAIMNYLAFEADRPRWALDGIWTVLYWMPLPEPPEKEKQ